MSDSSNSRRVGAGKVIAIAAVPLIALAAGLALSSDASSAQENIPPNRFAQIEYPNAVRVEWSSGKEVYDQTCGYCHEQPNVAPVILGRSLPPALTAIMVRRGQNGMPAFSKTNISDEELAMLGTYIQESDAPPAPAPHGPPPANPAGGAQ